MKMWTKEHAMLLIPAFAVMIALSILLGYLLRNKEEKYRMIPIQIISVILLVLGVIKQVYYLIRPEGYDMFAIPAHFCSLALFFLPIFAFYKGKYKENIRAFTYLCCAVIMVFMIIYPRLEFSAKHIVNFTKSIKSFHTVTFHLLVCFAFMLIIALRLYDYDTKRDKKIIPIWIGIFCVISASVSHLLKTNFNNFYASSVGFVENIRTDMISQIGWIGQLIYVVFMIALTIGFSYACYYLVRGAILLIQKIIKRIKQKKNLEIIG